MPDVDRHLAGVLAVADDLAALRTALDRLTCHARQGSVPDSCFGSAELHHDLPTLLAAHQDDVARILTTAAAQLADLADDLRRAVRTVADLDLGGADALRRAGG